jgi:hypothetical protein
VSPLSTQLVHTNLQMLAFKGLIFQALTTVSIRGTLRLEKTTKQLKLDARNWECGVIVPVYGPTIAAPHSQSKSRQRAYVEENDSLDAVFGGIVPVPMITPGEEYGNKKPWVMSFDN